jgi:nitroreductase
MINEILSKRRSTVLFSSKPIENEILLEIFEAARWAPSSNNIQPWRFIYAIQGDSFYTEFLDCMNEKNQLWASKAPLLLLTIAQIFSDDQTENKYALHDTGMAYANLVFQAVSRDLSVHPMGGFDKAKARAIAGIPSDYVPVTMAAVGYNSYSGKFDPYLIEKEKRPRVRKQLSEIAFYGRFTNYN